LTLPGTAALRRTDRDQEEEMMKRAFLMLSAMIVIAGYPPAAYAGFADDWLANSTTTSPSYFEGQKRGYLSAGGFSARWKTSNDYLLSVTPPRIRAGCGGIDAFWGGMSFLDPDYLVEKLERIVENAPAVALDLALNVLCEPCSNAMKWMEDKANMLNQLQLDDCKASKAIVAKSMQAFGSEKGELNDIIADFEVSSNLKKFYKKSQDDAGGNVSGSSASGAVADCDADIRAIFVTKAETNGRSSILTNIAEKLGMPASYAQLLAGMVGDVGIDKQPTTGFTTYDIPFCEQNRTLNVDGLLSDRPYLRDFNDPTGQCGQATDANGNIMQYVSDKLASIMNKMETKSALMPQEEAFLNYSSGVVYSALKLAVETKTVDVVGDTIGRIVAKDITRHLLNDLYSKGESMLAKTMEIAKKKEETATDKPYRCQLSLFNGAFEKVKDMRQRIASLREELGRGYQKELEQMNALTAFIREHQDAARRFEAEVGRRFGNQVLGSRAL
jgi:conjugative transfer pilus assembly protein TraH